MKKNMLHRLCLKIIYLAIVDNWFVGTTVDMSIVIRFICCLIHTFSWELFTFEERLDHISVGDPVGAGIIIAN